MAEDSSGQIDAVITSNQIDIDLSSTDDNDKGIYLNYTRVKELYGSQYNLSPRKNFCGVQFGSDYTNLEIADPYDENDMNSWRS
jgi:hypothetical protein